MSDEGRIVPPHGSGPGEEARQKPRPPFAYPGRNPHWNDPDETEGRRLYRGRANSEAALAMALTRRITLASVGRNAKRQDRNGLGPKDEHAVPKADAQTLSGSTNDTDT